MCRFDNEYRLAHYYPNRVGLLSWHPSSADGLNMSFTRLLTSFIPFSFETEHLDSFLFIHICFHRTQNNNNPIVNCAKEFQVYTIQEKIFFSSLLRCHIVPFPLESILCPVLFFGRVLLRFRRLITRSHAARPTEI